MPDLEVPIRIPTMSGGVSRQPAHMRFPNQHESADNTQSSVVDGVSKRQGSFYVKLISGLTNPTSGDYRMHLITRDQNERYLLVYGEGNTIQIFEVYDEDTLIPATVTITSAASTYLGLNSPSSDQLKLVTMTDLTLVLNSTVGLGLTTSDDFTVQRAFRDFATMIRATLGVNEYARVRAPLLDDIEYWKYSNGGETATFPVVRMDKMKNNEWSRPNGAWNDPTKNPMGFTVTFRRFSISNTGMAWNSSAKTLTKAGAFSSYTFTSGEMIQITGGSDVTEGWYEITASDANSVTLDSEITTDSENKTDVAFAGIGKEVGVSSDMEFRYSHMQDIADRWTDEFRDQGIDALVEWVSVGSKRGYFQLTGPYRGSEATITGPNKAQGDNHNLAIDEGPFKKFSVTQGTGTAVRDELPPEERWEQVAAPKQDGALPDKTKMPIKVLRTGYTGDGVTPATFTIDQITWTPRKSGTSVTNPAPAIFDKDSNSVNLKGADLSFLHNRLWLAAGERVAASQAGDFFNFYVDNHRNLIDSDPIDRNVGSTSEEVHFVDFMVPFRRSMVIFSKSGKQFEMSTPDVISPTSLQIEPATSYKTLAVRPKDSGLFLYFLSEEKDSASLREYLFEERRAQNDASNLNAHTRGLLPNTMRSICTFPNHSMVAVIPKDCNEIFMYSSFWQGTEKVQSSWDRWVFDAGYDILDIAAVRSDLYMLVETAGNVSIELIPVVREFLETVSL